MQEKREKAVVLFSGGLDSATVLAMTREQGYDSYALSFDYGQRHRAELRAAEQMAARLGAVEHRILRLDLGSLGGSALVDESLDVPLAQPDAEDIPITYVPARNTVFLSFGLAWAEVLQARHLFIGVNAVDYSGYPDCRPEFISAFEATANLGTRSGVEGDKLSIHTPLVNMSKADIVRAGTELGVDYALTVSCYQADDSGAACGLCDACYLRRKGFEEAGISDPTRYAAS